MTFHLRRLFDYLRRQRPAVTLGAITTALLGVVDLLNAVQSVVPEGATWLAAVPVLLSFVIQRFVYAPATYDRAVEETYG